MRGVIYCRQPSHKFRPPSSSPLPMALHADFSTKLAPGPEQYSGLHDQLGYTSGRGFLRFQRQPLLSKDQIRELINVQIATFGQPNRSTSTELEDCHRRAERIRLLGQELDRIGTSGIPRGRFWRRILTVLNGDRPTFSHNSFSLLRPSQIW